MAYIMFSSTFPKGHPKQGLPTRFVELIWLGLLRSKTCSFEDMYTWLDEYDGIHWDTKYIQFHLDGAIVAKTTTIRPNFSKSEGHVFEPRIWSGKPYGKDVSQIAFTPALTINKTETFEILSGIETQINGTVVDKIGPVSVMDGLATEDFKAWFGYEKGKSFFGQRLHFGINQ